MQQAVKAPVHLWIIGVLSLLWNSIGAFDYTATQLRIEDYLKGYSPEVLAWIDGIPAWAIAAWAVGVWGSFLGSISLLLRKSWAVWLFGASLIGLALNSLYAYGMSDYPKINPGGGTITAVISVVVIALLFYSRAMEKRDVLR